jgi:IS6 family transposase
LGLEVRAGGRKAAALEIEKRLRWQRLRPQATRCLVDETYVKVGGKWAYKWAYLHRELDTHGNTIDFYLSPAGNAKTAKRFLGKALNELHAWEKPGIINMDKAPTCGIDLHPENPIS